MGVRGMGRLVDWDGCFLLGIFSGLGSGCLVLFLVVLT